VLIEVLNDEKIDPVLSHFQIVAVAVEDVKISRRYSNILPPRSIKHLPYETALE